MRLLHVMLACMLLWAPTGIGAEPITEATLYKAPWCGCCSEYGKYLEQHGFAIRIEEMEDLAPIKRKAGVPPEQVDEDAEQDDGGDGDGHAVPRSGR